jgi:hypothetical protein
LAVLSVFLFLRLLPGNFAWFVRTIYCN